MRISDRRANIDQPVFILPGFNRKASIGVCDELSAPPIHSKTHCAPLEVSSVVSLRSVLLSHSKSCYLEDRLNSRISSTQALLPR